MTSRKQSRKPSDKRRSGLGASPLEVLMPQDEEAAPATTSSSSRARRSPPERSTPRAKANGAKPDARPRKVRSTYHLPEDLVEELRNAALNLAGPPEFLTLSGLVEDALRRQVDRLRKKHHKGKPFPQRPHDLRGGRPVGS